MGLSAMSDAEASEWAGIKQRGCGRHVLMVGVLGWGIPTGVGAAALMSLFGAPGPFLGRLVLTVAVFTVGGIVYGRTQWAHNQRRYEAWERSASQRATP